MKVKQLMTSELVACTPNATLNDAASLMWQHDCGFTLVTTEDTGEICGCVTDRDVCMAAFTKGALLAQIPVESVMNPSLITCSPGDDVEVVHELMRQHEIRRIPVVEDGRPVGVVSLNDLALAAESKNPKALEKVGRTLAAVCRHRQPAGV